MQSYSQYQPNFSQKSKNEFFLDFIKFIHRHNKDLNFCCIIESTQFNCCNFVDLNALESCPFLSLNVQVFTLQPIELHLLKSTQLRVDASILDAVHRKQRVQAKSSDVCFCERLLLPRQLGATNL